MRRVFWLKAAGVLLAVSVCIAVVVREYIRNETRRWFSGNLPAPEEIRQWAEAELDRSLYKLSRWESFSPGQFRSFVKHQIGGLRLEPAERFRFLEVGVGVGAFARCILQHYPNSTGVGIDLESSVIALAVEVLPRDRMRLFVADMVRIPSAPSSFDYVLVPGSLCYLHSLHDVRSALSEFSRVLRPGGGLCASMLASATSDMGSCNTRIPKSIWGNMGAFRVVAMEEMDDWKLPHAFGRYSVCLRKEGGTRGVS